MKIHLLYFASVREAAGVSEETVTLDAPAPTLAALCAHLQARGAMWENILNGEPPVKFSVNQQFADLSAPLQEGCEVALFPPVTGG